MNIFVESVAIILAGYLAGYIIFGGKQSAITLIALIASLITVYWTNKHVFARDFSRICSLMRRAISNKKKTEEQQQERLKQAERKITDFFTNKLEGETKKSDDKEKAIDLRDYNIFEESENKEKEIYLVEYSYRWYLGLRAKNIFEEEMDVLQDFLNHIWNCYGVFSAKKLLSMLGIETMAINNNSRYSILEATVGVWIDNKLEGWIDNKQYNFMQTFYSYHNKAIEIYLPTNVALKISDNGLYEIVRVGAYD